MANRSYRQYCPLAYSLDVIGERWTLLIIRELLFGPRRFKDIAEGLPGIGTNLLAARLKSLDNARILKKQTLPPPAGSTVYELTSRGQELRPTVLALAEWGLSLMGKADDSDILGVVPTMSALTMLFDKSAAEPIVCELHVAGEVFQAGIREEIKVTPGTGLSADLVIEADPKTILQLLGKPQQAVGAIQNGRLILLRGDRNLVKRFFNHFRTLDSVGSSA